jgi:hypothetical protein
MNCKKILTGALTLAGALLFASAAHAQVVIGVGSSALFPSVGIAAVSPDPIAGTAAPCGTNFWSAKNGTASNVIQGIDPRGGGTVAEGGNIWIAWNSSASIVCAYLSVDSVVGQRLYFAQGAAGNGTLNISLTTGGSIIAGLTDSQGGVASEATPPAAVISALQGKHFNVDFTDIRPEDGQFANGRAGNDFGYNPGCALHGTPVYSSFSNSNAQVDCYYINGNDPYSGDHIPTWTTVSLGASPVVMFISTKGNMSGGTLPTDIPYCNAQLFFSGQIGSSQSVFGPGVVNTVLSEIQREPVSGTYNTFEWQNVHARACGDGNYSQEDTLAGTYISPGAVPGCWVGGSAAYSTLASCSNPLFLNSGANSVRYRAIGTSEMVKAVNGTTSFPTTDPDRVGYAFYSLGSFFIAAPDNLKYVTLGGEDGLYPNYNTSGLFGTCSGAITTSNFKCTTVLPSFTNVQNGGYRVWSTLRAVLNTAAPLPPALATTLLEAIQDQAAYALENPSLCGISTANTAISAIADFVPANSYPGGVATPFLTVFRSHYGLGAAGVTPADANDGTTTNFCAADQSGPPCYEEGGDMAGTAYPIVTDVSYFNVTSSELLTEIE